MDQKFNAGEVFEMASEMERNGAEFYSRAADRIEDEAIAKLLYALATMEQDHAAGFAAMAADLTEAEKGGELYDPDGQATLYLKAIVGTRVFADLEMDASSVEGVLKTAIAAEKEAILFYSGIKQAVEKTAIADRVEMIIREEMVHLLQLNQELDRVCTAKTA